MQKDTTFVGLDTSKKSIQIAMISPDRDNAVEWEEVNDPRGVRRLIRKLKRDAIGELQVCYEAGPCGYALQREFRAADIACIIIAPSLVPVKPGDRIKTNRRDAKKLAQQFRAGALTEVHPPTPEEEGVRDLCRCREDIREDLMRARHRLGKMLLRRALVFPGKAWTKAHRQWLTTLKFDFEADQTVFDDYVRALEHLEERAASIDAKLVAVSQKAPWAEPVAWLRCFHGIETTTAISIVAEIHGFARFPTARHFMSYLGLVPSENSTGEKHRRGRITRSGNAHVRRLLIEASKHYRHKPRVGAKLQKRRSGQPGSIIAIADRAQSRLHRRYWRLLEKGKAPNKAGVAVARELAGFIWATLCPNPAAGEGTNTIQGKEVVLLAQQRPMTSQPARRSASGGRR